MKRLFWVVLSVTLVAAGPAAAEPISTLIATVSTALSVSVATATFIVQIGFSLVSSALAAALQKRPDSPRRPGIKTDSTSTGGNNPETFVLGKYATAGNMVAPPYSHPNDGSIPNQYLTYVIDVSGAPGVTFNRLMVAGEYITDLQASDGDHDLEGMIEGGAPHMFLTWHDGTQTAADAYMMANYADYPERPWSSDMVGEGLAYAVVTFRYNRELFNSLPGVRFEVLGIPLYDPRRDTSVGGDGGQRWDDPVTWAQSDNPIVMIYHILRGITLPGGRVWGGRVPAGDLPLANWFAAMNECDVEITLKGGGTQPQYRAGYEVAVNETPASVIEELLKACSAEISEFGGVYKVRVGPPGLPVYYFSDDDIVIDQPQTLQPYPGLDGVHNGIHASYPAPQALWETRDAPPRYNAAWEAEDGDRQLVAQVDLPAVPYGRQVQRLMKAWIRDERRFRRHNLTLPPEAAILEPLDTVAWTSTRNGYTSKVFEVGEVTDDLTTILQGVSLRERDQGDFVWVPTDDEIDVVHPSTLYVPPVQRTVPGWDVSPASVKDASGAGRRPAVLLAWDPDRISDSAALEYEIRPAGLTELVASGSITNLQKGSVKISEGILPGAELEVRGRLLVRRARAWTAWTAVTVGDIRLSSGDLPADVDDWSEATDDPVAVLLSTSLIADGRAEMTATWASVTDAAYYELGITRTGGSENILPVDGTSFSFESAPGVEWSVRLRTRNALNKPSGWTASEVLTAASDSTAPPVPGQPTLTASFRSIWADWSFAGASDFSHFELCYKATAGTPAVSTTAPIIKTASQRIEIGGLDAATTRYVFVRAVDTSENKSDWSVGSSATTLAGSSAVTTEDLEGLIDQTSFASGLAAIEIVSSVPSDADPANFPGRAVVDISDGIGKLYRFIGGSWTSAVDGEDLVLNSVTTGAIRTGAVKTAQLDAGAVTARTVAIGDFTNLILNSRLENDEGWAFNGSVGVGTDSVATTPGVFVLPVDVTNRYAWTATRIPVEPGDQFFARAKARGTGSFEARIVFRFYDKDGNVLEQPSSLLAATSSYLSFNLSHTAPAGATELRCDFGRSGGGSGTGYISAPFLMRKNTGEMIVDGVLKANHFVTDEAVITVTAQIANAIISSAKISDLEASKITVGAMNAGITVGATGVTIGTVESRSDDPAIVVNNRSTLIQPGKIQISGSTTIEDWRRAGDQTKIDGGQISTATVTAEKLQIGLRGLAVSELNFSTSGNVLSWTAGRIKYIDDNGTESTRFLTASSFDYAGKSGIWYIYWTRGATTLSSSDDLATANTGENVVLASYRGGQDVNPNFGRTIIEGDYIATGAITADKANFSSLAALGLKVDSADIKNLAVKNAQIDNLTITAGKVESNGITKVRKSTGTNPSITFTPSIDGEMTAMVWLDIETEGVGFSMGTVTLRIDGDSYGYMTVRREDATPGVSYAQETGMIVWKINTSAGVSMTIDLQNSGATINAASIVAIETKR